MSSRNSDSGVVMRMSAGALERGALTGRRVAGANRHLRRVYHRAAGGRHLRDAGEWRPQVALDVDGERFQRRDVEHAATRVARRQRRRHQPIETPEERGERLAGAGRCQDQRGVAARDRRPAQRLRTRRRGERLREPRRHRGLEEAQDVVSHHSYNASDVRRLAGPSGRRHRREDRPDLWVTPQKG
ncbi:MAG: hypothetical protein U0P30_18035 [Vicinamibacterales bacterium]